MTSHTHLIKKRKRREKIYVERGKTKRSWNTVISPEGKATQIPSSKNVKPRKDKINVEICRWDDGEK